MNGVDPTGADCQDISPLIPWYVNGTLDAEGCHRVDTHAAACEFCRSELSQDQRLYRIMNIESTVEFMPATSLKRLLARLDDGELVTPSRVVDYRPIERRALVAATLVVLCLGLGVMATARFMRVSERPSEALYYTVTAPQPRTPGAVIRAVFAPTSTLSDVQAILDAAGLRIVAGPTEAGVYSLSSDTRHTLGASLGILRANAQVRFAESIQAAPERGDGP